jgi:hypothetical protein
MMGKIPPWSILLPSLVFVFFLAVRVSFLGAQPSGWDYFYHTRVVGLSISQQKLLPFDSLSAGGRTQTYPPFYYSLVISAAFLSGIRPELLLRLFSPLFLLLAALSIFLFLGKSWGAAVGSILFATFSEVLILSSSSGIPAVASLLMLAVLTSAVFSSRKIPAPLLILLSLALGALQPLSAAVFSIICLVRFFMRRTPSVLYGLVSIIVPALWSRVFPITLPNWGAVPSVPQLLNSFSLQHLLAVPLLIFSSGPLAIFSVLLALSFFSPVLPGRFVLYLAFPLSFAAAGRKWAGALAAVIILFSAFFFAPKVLQYVEPIMKPADFEGLAWIGLNLRSDSIVVGHTDFSSVFLMGRAATIIDGFSEGLSDARVRQADISAAYSSGDFSSLSRKYGARYAFTDKTEEKKGLAVSGTELFDNTYSKVLKLAAEG